MEWSATPTFDVVSRATIPAVSTEYTIRKLQQGTPVFVRVACCNMKGIGDAVPAAPFCLAPSDWRDVNQSVNRLAEFQKQILEISDKMARRCLLKCGLNACRSRKCRRRREWTGPSRPACYPRCSEARGWAS